MEVQEEGLDKEWTDFRWLLWESYTVTVVQCSVSSNKLEWIVLKLFLMVISISVETCTVNSG